MFQFSYNRARLRSRVGSASVTSAGADEILETLTAYAVVLGERLAAAKPVPDGEQREARDEAIRQMIFGTITFLADAYHKDISGALPVFDQMDVQVRFEQDESGRDRVAFEKLALV